MAKVKYRISSRATILLGRENVSKVDGALIELIKNTYDADASFCYVLFDTENDSLYIIDNGVGMTEESIKNNWMVIGTNNKVKEYKSKKGRIKSGAKGIGRFALDRLGRVCELYTKHEESDDVIRWINDWDSFEEDGKFIEDIEADIDEMSGELFDYLPSEVYETLKSIRIKFTDENKEEQEKALELDIGTGTIIKISSLRDKWSTTEISGLIENMSFLIPPSEQNQYNVIAQRSRFDEYVQVESGATSDFDYKLHAKFDGKKFIVTINRNEFDIDRFPKDIFNEEPFNRAPYREEDFKSSEIVMVYSISELIGTKDEDLISDIRRIGAFEFNYIFMKQQGMNVEKSLTKKVSPHRKLWLEQFSGIKMYRDNFIVRPYGDRNSDSFDWLGLDSRQAKNPAGVGDSRGGWTVGNNNSQGTVLISRVDNFRVADKSGREGLIENAVFSALKTTLIQLISVFEKDRAQIFRGVKNYRERIEEKENTKKEAKQIASKVLSKKPKKKKNTTQKSNSKKESTSSVSVSEDELKKLAKSVEYYEEDRAELITEIKLLRSLATNGLITTSIVHDLKSINALLVTRVDSFRLAVERSNRMLLDRNLDDLDKNDQFLKAWISVVTEQTKHDKRRRLKKNIHDTIQNLTKMIEPILSQKKIQLQFNCSDREVYKRIFVSDIESIFYNLIINSIESFEQSGIKDRRITIILSKNNGISIEYYDNGKGLDEKFKDPNEIFEFGVTSKLDRNGKRIGTGLGMYIVATTADEYSAKYKILDVKEGFGLSIVFPE